MNKYYAMITPGSCGDWGDVILIDSRVGDFIELAVSWDDEGIEEFKAHFMPDTWRFLKEEFNAIEQDDYLFIENISDHWDSLLSDNYYDFRKLNSTLKFNGISNLINYIKENNLEVIGDFT